MIFFLRPNHLKGLIGTLSRGFHNNYTNNNNNNNNNNIGDHELITDKRKRKEKYFTRAVFSVKCLCRYQSMYGNQVESLAGPTRSVPRSRF